LKPSHSRNRRSLLKSFAAMTTMGAFLFLVAAPAAHADEREKCRQRIEKAEARLNYAITKHGETSKEARERWHELRAEREHCWASHHQWWSGRDRRWHTEPDWDRDDRWPEEHEHEH